MNEYETPRIATVLAKEHVAMKADPNQSPRQAAEQWRWEQVEKADPMVKKGLAVLIDSVVERGNSANIVATHTVMGALRSFEMAKCRLDQLMRELHHG